MSLSRRRLVLPRNRKKRPRNPFVDDPFLTTLVSSGTILPFDYRERKVECKEIVEFNPSKIKPGETKVFQVSKWFGLKKMIWVIQNIGGKYFKVRRLA